MLEVDLHAHTFFSKCGIHTHLELLNRAKELGLKGLAITDHGPALKSRITLPFFDRLKNPVDGIRFIKGIECNLLDEQGTIDITGMPSRYTRHIELVLLGLHPNIEKDLGKKRYTDMVVKAIKTNPCIDIIAHPNELEFPLDLEQLAGVAKEYGVALELNNSKTLYNRTTPEVTKELIQVCKKIDCRMAIGSDTHAIEELGLDDSVRPYLVEERFPQELLINGSARRAFDFIEERKSNKIEMTS